MASAPTTKIGNGQLPTGFISPFKRVPMQGSHDSLLAIAATLSGKTMEEVRTSVREMLKKLEKRKAEKRN